MAFLNQNLRAYIKCRPVRRISFNGRVDTFARTGDVVRFEELVLGLVDQLHRIHVTAPPNYNFNRSRKRWRADQRKNDDEENKSHIAVLPYARQILQDWRLFSPQGFSKPDQLVGDLSDARNNLFVCDLIAIEGIAGCVDESRYDHGPEIEHETVRVGHHRH